MEIDRRAHVYLAILETLMRQGAQTRAQLERVCLEAGDPAGGAIDKMILLGALREIPGHLFVRGPAAQL